MQLVQLLCKAGVENELSAKTEGNAMTKDEKQCAGKSRKLTRLRGLYASACGYVRQSERSNQGCDSAQWCMGSNAKEIEVLPVRQLCLDQCVSPSKTKDFQIILYADSVPTQALRI